MDSNVKEYKFQITIDSLRLQYDRGAEFDCVPTVWVIGDITLPDGYSQKCDMILPGMQQRFETHIAKLYQDGLTGDALDSHFKAITILFDEMREAQSDGCKGIG